MNFHVHINISYGKIEEIKRERERRAYLLLASPWATAEDAWCLPTPAGGGRVRRCCRSTRGRSAAREMAGGGPALLRGRGVPRPRWCSVAQRRPACRASRPGEGAGRRGGGRSGVVSSQLARGGPERRRALRAAQRSAEGTGGGEEEQAEAARRRCADDGCGEMDRGGWWYSAWWFLEAFVAAIRALRTGSNGQGRGSCR